MEQPNGMKTTNEFISNILSSAALDSRIESGILEIHNQDHINIIAEHMFEHGLDAQLVMEVVNNLVIYEGKYPDRQAYNTDGWLVTFPSAEYRKQAIIKGTHFATDPTHGKGGMHLYYKSKGKQFRDKQQSTSAIDPNNPQQGVAPVAPAAAVAPPADGAAPAPATDAQSVAAQAAQPTQPAPTASDEEPAPETDSELSPSDTPPSGAPATSAAGVPTPSVAQVGGPPVAPVTAGPSIVELSKKFAASKGWTETPYGEWNTTDGQKIAVTGYDGQVVPVNHPDREALSSFIDKNKTG